MEKTAIVFTPAFGFDPGQDYVARIGTEETKTRIPFQIAPDQEPVLAAVTAIFPSGDRLPENTLRFYIHFSVPMQPHVAFDHIALRDASGVVDDAAFMRFKQELWNENRTRLTVLIDPGRIKRNVATNVERGPALLAGQEYTLLVDAGWPSADGMSHLPAFTKNFTVTAPLRNRPDIGQWEISTPCFGTKDPLRIVFDRPFDRHLLGRTIQVISQDRDAIAGPVELAPGEQQWTFFPDEQWQTGGAMVLVSADLEDVAANNFRDTLDHVQSDQAHGLATLTTPLIFEMCTDDTNHL